MIPGIATWFIVEYLKFFMSKFHSLRGIDQALY